MAEATTAKKMNDDAEGNDPMAQELAGVSVGQAAAVVSIIAIFNGLER